MSDVTEVAVTGRVPLWVKKPGLLGAIVQDTLELGRADLASENNMVKYTTVQHWIAQGMKELEKAEAEGADEITILAQFALEVQQAKSLFISGRLRRIMELAETDPEYKNFHLWIVENVDEQKRFSKWTNIRSTSEETKNVNIRVTYATGQAWITGGQAQNAMEGDVVETEMRQIAPPVEDF